MLKYVNAPLNIKDMDDDLHSGTIYCFNYQSSELKGSEFYHYLKSSGITCDINFENTSFEDKSLILKSYMSDLMFNNIHSLNIVILNIVKKIKSISKRNVLSCFSEDEEQLFYDSHKDLFNDWIKFYDSLFYLNLCSAFVTSINDIQGIKSFYRDISINSNELLSPNMVSLLSENDFYDIYDNGIDENNISYYTYHFENKIYDDKSIFECLLFKNNHYLSIIHSLLYDEKFRNFLKIRNIC